MAEAGVAGESGILEYKDNVISARSSRDFVVSKFLFEELILQRQFNDGGTAQLCFDIQQNLIPLFSQLTSKPESYFRE